MNHMCLLYSGLMEFKNQYRDDPDDSICRPARRPFMVEKELGFHRRRRRSIHGKDFHNKGNNTTLNRSSGNSFYPPHLELGEDSVIQEIIDSCTDIDEIINKLKEQTISLTKKRCVKSMLKPAQQSKIIKLSYIKKMKYKMGISCNKLKIGLRNFLHSFELWYSSLKVIEGKFGSSVATYFKFLRKLFILNFIIFSLNLLFIILPQILYYKFSSPNISGIDTNFNASDLKLNKNPCGENLPDYSDEEYNLFFFPRYSNTQGNQLRLGNLFTGMGYLSDSVLFYGHYLNTSFSLSTGYAYDMPSAYFFSIAFCYFLVLCVLFFSVAESYKKCYIETSNGVHNVFAEKIFCGWDFGIAKRDAEELRYSSIHMELKELLNEADRGRKRKKQFEWFYTTMIRVSLNLILLLLLIGLGWYASTYLDVHMDNADIPTVMMLTLLLTLVTTLAPVCFSWLSKIEFYECPRTALYMTLIRTFILHILNITIIVVHRLNSAPKIICWETVVGQDIYRLVILDFIIGVASNMVEFIRSRLNRRCKKIELPDFNIALNTMNLIYNQALLYVGLYFSPGLSLIVSVKMFLTFYLKKWGAMHNCRPSKKPWRAAQMQTVFLSFAFLVFFGVIITYGYIFNSVQTSSCGPFAGGKYVFQAVLYEILHDGINSKAVLLLSHFFRSGVSVILLIAMILGTYYLRTVNLVRRRMVKNLRHIIKEQVAHKKMLLKKIHKAQEDFKQDFKKTNGERKKASVTNRVHVAFDRSGENSSELDDNGEDIPLRRPSGHLRESNIIRLHNRLCRSSYNFDVRDNTEKRLASAKSLQNLSAECSKANIASPKRTACSSRSSVNCSHDEVLISNCKIVPENEEIICNKENCALGSINYEAGNTAISKEHFSYDDRVPSRIYFQNNKK